MNKCFAGIWYVLSIVYAILTLLLFFDFIEPQYELQETVFGLKWFVFWAIARTYANENRIK